MRSRWTADRLVARKDANVRTPEDLYKIRIGLLQGSTASADLYYLAKHYKLDEKRLQVVNMPPPEQLAALNSGGIQAMLCWQPWGYNALKAGNTELIHTGLKSEFAANKGQDAQISYTRSLFVASQEFVRKNPVATQRMMEVLLRGAALRRRSEEPRGGGRAVRRARPSRTARLPTAIWDQYTFDPVFDDRYVRDMERLTEFLVASGRLKSPKHPLDYTFTEPRRRRGQEPGEGARALQGVADGGGAARSAWRCSARASSPSITSPGWRRPAAPTSASSSGARATRPRRVAEALRRPRRRASTSRRRSRAPTCRR